MEAVLQKRGSATRWSRVSCARDETRYEGTDDRPVISPELLAVDSLPQLVEAPDAEVTNGVELAALTDTEARLKLALRAF
jgi:hypothetical protein